MRLFRNIALVIAGPLLATRSFATEPARQPKPLLHQQRYEQALLIDAADGQFDQHSLLQAALIASGVDDAQRLARYQARVESLLGELRREASQVASPRDKSATALAFLHREVLTGPYDAGCCDLALTLDQGRYNCVTGSLLFSIFGDALDLAPRGWHWPGHVRIKLAEPSSLEVETTCREWFTQPNIAQISTTGRQLSPVALVGKIYYNRGVQALDHGDTTKATIAFEQSLALDPLDTTSQRNLLAALNNGALALCEQQQFALALAKLQAARQIDANYASLAANELHIRQRWMVKLCEAGQFATALEILAPLMDEPAASSLCTAGRAAVYQLWAEDLMRRGETHTALTKVELGLAIMPASAPLQSLRQKLRS